MNQYFVTDETEKVWVDDQHWVGIKSKLSIADQDKFNQSLWEVEVEEPEGFDQLNRSERRRLTREEGVQRRIKPRFKPSTLLFLEIAIVNWSFDMPVSRENIGKLQPWLAGFLEDEVNKRNPLARPTQTTTETSSKDEVPSNSPGQPSGT